MCHLFKLLQRKYVWAVTMAILLTGATVYTLLDAFVLPKAYVSFINPASDDVLQKQPLNEAIEYAGKTDDTALPSVTSDAFPASEAAETVSPREAVITETTYRDDQISISIEKAEKNGLEYYVADVQLSDISALKTAFANHTFGKNITQTTSAMAQANQAVFAVNGDYYGFRDSGLIIRNGVLYRDQARNAPDDQALLVDSKGNLIVVTEGTVSGPALIADGILQSFSFGPVLVQDGQTVPASTKVSRDANPRTAIGQIEPLHYIFVVADGRSNTSKGMTLEELAQVFADRGCTVAYNLDGGGSSSMWFNGKIINNPTDGRKKGERSISDIIYLGEGAV